MWQKFTERARRVILLAQEEAGKMNSGDVGTEHLLLGLGRESEGFAAQLLLELGASPESVRTEIETRAIPDSATGGGEPKLTPKAKRALELAADEARRLRHSYIGAEHLLLALLREKDDLAVTVLRRLGLNLEDVRARIIAHLGPATGESPDPARPIQAPPVQLLTPEEVAARLQTELEMDAVASLGYSPAALNFLARVAQQVLDGGGSQIGMDDLLRGFERELAEGRVQIIEKPAADASM